MIKSRQGSLRLAHAQRAIAFEMLIRTAMAPCFILLLFVVFCSNTAVHGAALKTDDHQASMMVEFNCPPLPPLARPASNVYELKPQDIKVVMALGDSITAGMLYRHCIMSAPLAAHRVWNDGSALLESI